MVRRHRVAFHMRAGPERRGLYYSHTQDASMTFEEFHPADLAGTSILAGFFRKP